MQDDQNPQNEAVTPPEVTFASDPNPTPEPIPPVSRKQKLVDLLRRHKKPAMLAGAAVVLLLGSGVYAAVVLDHSDLDAKYPAVSQRSLLGAETLLVDGAAEYSTNGVAWKSLAAAQKLEEGDKVRAQANGRVVINLDDGSAIRVNSNSAVTLTNLDSKNVVITNDDGEVYTRVVASDRSFNVKLGDETYTALGTAYKTINSDSTKGVEVYQSQVSVKAAKQTVAEGKRYYQVDPAADLAGKVTDIPLDQLQKDDFLKWNLDHDKKSDEFKDKLGYFVALEKTPAPAPAPAPKPTSTPTGITLSGAKSEKGVSLSWKVNGLTISKGFKVVKGTSANPTYGKQDAMFVEASARSTTWKITDGKTYNFRICVYNYDGSCTNYSNNVAVTVPYVAPPAPPSGSLSLSHVSGNTVAWTLSGSAPYGLKLLWSTSTGPSYQNHDGKSGFDGASNSAATFSGTAGQTYYLRVCMYYEGSCMNYSNEISVTLP